MRLSYYDMNGKLYHHEIDKGLIRIGRDPFMDLSLVDSTVSACHASISSLGNNFYLTDLDSTNGTKLNGTYISKSVLKEGDHFQLGEFSLWFELKPDPNFRHKIIELEVVTRPPHL